MAKVSILIAFLTQFLCALGQKQLSQCFEYFTYMTKPGTTDILGQIKIPHPSANDTFYLKVALSTTTELLSQVIRLELARSIKKSLRHVHQGRPLLYHVHYPMNEQIPSVSAIWFNNQRYCPGPEVSDNITANVELGHILSPPNKEPIVYNDGSWTQSSQPWHRNVSKYRIYDPSFDRLNHYSELNECGITSYYPDDTNRLMSDGETALPGQWPWLVAIYVQYNERYIFTWTGSLITTRHVVTAWSCLRDFYRELIEPQNLWVILEQFKSSLWNQNQNHTGTIKRMVTNCTSYPSIQNNGSTCLVILLLRTAVEYNAFVRPVCLWSGSTNRQDTVHMTGYVVGWTYFQTDPESGIYYPWTKRWEPQMSKMQLANIREVHTIGENDYYFSLVYPTVPCCTDIGNGLVVFNTTMGHYQLRGVTTGIPVGGVEFFDVAKVTSWIQQQIQLT